MAPMNYVTLVAVGGTPVRLADPSGAPYPTTGTGAIVFADGAVLNNVVLNNPTIGGFSDTVVNAQLFGAKGDGVTIDTKAINKAVASLPDGGVVYLPPTGAGYVVDMLGIILTNGVRLAGSGTIVFPGSTASLGQWTAQGTWIIPTDPTNPAVTCQGHGSAVYGINFIHQQPAPTGGSWTPNQYGPCIKVIASYVGIDNVRIINAYDGIIFQYSAASGGGTNCCIKDVLVSAFNTRLGTHFVNDTMYWSDVHCRNLWNASNPLIYNYIRANATGWDAGYTDNIMVNGLEFFEDRGIFCTDETVTVGGTPITHSLFNFTMTNVQFNLPQRSMQVAAATTTVTGHFGIVTAQQGNAFGLTYSDTVFDLGSDNVDIAFSSLKVLDAGGVVFNLGAGGGGKITCGRMEIQNYSTVAAGQTGIVMAAGSTFDGGVVPTFFKNASAGTRIGGAGANAGYTSARSQSWTPFSVPAQVTGVAGTGAYAQLTTSNFTRPGILGVYQIRIIGNENVTTASAATIGSYQLTGLTECTTPAFSTAATGVVNWDSGWIDITEANLASLQIIGAIAQNHNSAVQFSTGDCFIQVR